MVLFGEDGAGASFFIAGQPNVTSIRSLYLHCRVSAVCISVLNLSQCCPVFGHGPPSIRFLVQGDELRWARTCGVVLRVQDEDRRRAGL